MPRLIGAVLILALLIGAMGFSQELTGKQIVKKMTDLMNQETVRSKMKMTITTSSGQERTFIYESFSKDKGEKTLMKYLEPKKLRGQAVLMLNNADDIWTYFPRTKRVRKLASHAKKQRMEGGDFSYEDLGSGNAFLEEFRIERKEDQKIGKYDCFTVELTKLENSDSSYSRVVMWVDKASFVPIQADYFDEKDPQLHLKRLTLSDIRVIDGIPTAMKMVMQNKLDNTKTTMEILEVEYNIELDDSMFTERGMAR